MNRREVLENFQFDLKKIDNFLNETGIKAPINIIDPECIKFQDLNYAAESTLAWISREIEVELEKENEILPDEGNPGAAVGQ